MKNNAFTLVETLIALVITSLSLLLLIAALQTLKRSYVQFYDVEDETRMRQLRLLYVLSEQVEVNDKQLNLSYLGEQMYLAQQEDNLILQKGYQVYLKELDWAIFTKENTCVYLEYKHKKKKAVKRIVGC